jgi:hypothetical protein
MSDSLKTTSGKSHSSTSSPTLVDVEKKFSLPYNVDAPIISQQPWICKADSVRHRLRGILITHDTYDLFRLSFEDDSSARTFLGELLVAMSTSRRIIRMSELQLEELNSNWDEAARYNRPQFEPVNLPVLVSDIVTYSLSSQWEIVKTLYYIALSQDILDTLCEDAYCKLPLNALLDATHKPMVKEVPYLRHSQQHSSAEFEFRKALEYSSSVEPKDSSPSTSLVHSIPPIVYAI